MNKKRIIFSSICVILLIALVGGTLSWFYVNEEVTVSYGNSIFCEAGDSLEISLIENGAPTKWTGSIDYSAGEFTTVDISGNGVNLYRPTEIDENQQPVKLVSAVSNLDDNMSYDYVEMVIAFRSISQMNVYLSEESFILPVDTSIPEDPGDPKNNIYGRFSRDYIAGAMRVAVIDYDTNELLMLWAPNSKYELIEQDGQYGYLYSFKTGENGDSTPESEYYFYAENEDGELVPNEVPADYYADKKFVVDSTGARKGYSGNSPVLATLIPPSEGVHAQKTVRIRIWFEGTDREAHQALAGGNVNVKLKFIGIAKDIDAIKQNAINNIMFDADSGTFTGLADGMVFSTDGRTWTAYTAETPNLPKLQSGDSIYIKYPETDHTFETSVRKFTMN